MAHVFIRIIYFFIFNTQQLFFLTYLLQGKMRLKIYIFTEKLTRYQLKYVYQKHFIYCIYTGYKIFCSKPNILHLNIGAP